MGALVLDPVPVGPGQVRPSTGPPLLEILELLKLAAGEAAYALAVKYLYRLVLH